MDFDTHQPAGALTNADARSRLPDLAQDEERYRLVVENATDVIWTAQLHGLGKVPVGLTRAEAIDHARGAADGWRFTFVSPSVERVLGYHVEDATRRSLKEVLTPESYAVALGILAEELLVQPQPDGDANRRRLVELEVVTRQGAARWCEVSVGFLRDSEGGLAGAMGATRDISERKTAENALRESEATLRGLVANMPDLVLVVDRRATILFANRGVPGASAEQLIGNTGFSFLQPDHRDVARRALAEAFESRSVVRCEVLDVFDLWWDCRLVPIVEADRVLRAMLICADITERRLAEESLHKEQEALRHLLDLMERDRELIAFELHDNIAQHLTGALLLFESSAQFFAESPEEARQALSEGMRVLRKSIRESRRLVGGLRPPALDEFGVLPAIEHLLEENRREAGLEVELLAPDDFPRLARPLENALFRIVQESFSNIHRHSRAKRARLEINCGEGHVRLAVRDFGVGFDPGAAEQGHFGLKAIRQRARLLGGHAQIESAPGKGTCIRVELPLVRGV
jgi:PAS domain S-box-containing protein